MRWLIRNSILHEECPLSLGIKDRDGNDICYVDESGDNCPPNGDREMCLIRCALEMSEEDE